MKADLLTKTAADIDGMAPTNPPASNGGLIYTCPMHPEVRQDHGGTCPK